ncbi:MAG: DUF6089 family protein [Bacteroidota bacterium]
MTSITKLSFSVLLILFLPLITNAENNSLNQQEAESNNSLFAESFYSASESAFFIKNYPGSYRKKDNFFSRLFGKKKSVAEKNSQSQNPSNTKKKHTPPASESELPMGSSKNGAVKSTSNSAVANTPKEPLSESRRDKVMSKSQWLMGLSFGSSHAVADIGNSKNMAFGEFVDYQFSNLGLSMGLFTKYHLNNWFALSFGMDYGSYKGVHNAPSLNDSYYYGYSFENNIFEFFAKTEFSAPFLATTPVDLYLFTGIGVFFNDMKLYDDDNRRVSPNEISDYSQTQPSIPVGLGFGYYFNNKLRIGYELGYRYTVFTFFDGVNIDSSGYDKYFSNSLKVSYNF